jgi:uncharacterized membrane protein (DUF2068 family)
MDWDRRHCARRGHILYEPTEPEYLGRLKVDTAVGEAWRCLRCGDFTVQAPKTRGPASNAPVVPRGKALRSLLIMRLLAVERIFRFLLVGAAAVGVWKFSDSQHAVQQLFEQDLTVFRPLARHWGYDLDNSSIVQTIRKTFQYKKSTLDIAAIALAAYALIELVEATGLWLAKRWGEYFAVVATAVFIPVEVYELTERATKFKIATLALNVAAVVYLLLAKRLFGLRGGKAAYEAELHSASLLEVSESAGVGPAQQEAELDTEAEAGQEAEAEAVAPDGSGLPAGSDGAVSARTAD